MIFIILMSIILVVGLFMLAYARFIDYPKSGCDSFSIYRQTSASLCAILGVPAVVAGLAGVLVLLGIAVQSREEHDEEYIEYQTTRELYQYVVDIHEFESNEVFNSMIQNFNDKVMQHRKDQHSFNRSIQYSEKYDWNNIPIIQIDNIN